MELNIDTGVEEFRVNGRGVLRFNPADPNLYHRFFAAGAELDGYDAALTKALAALDGDEQQRAAAGLALLNEYDGKIKKLLTGIFGAENDFDAILGGVNLAGVGANGKRVVQNLLEALTPILREGAERRLTAAADAAAAALARCHAVFDGVFGGGPPRAAPPRPRADGLAAGRTADRRGHQQGRGAGCAHAALPALVELSGVVRCHRRGELCNGGGHP